MDPSVAIGIGVGKALFVGIVVAFLAWAFQKMRGEPPQVGNYVSPPLSADEERECRKLMELADVESLEPEEKVGVINLCNSYMNHNLAAVRMEMADLKRRLPAIAGRLRELAEAKEARERHGDAAPPAD